MITCDKCGFGHKTFEEKRACKSWDEIAAAIQAAGSGAELLTAGDVESSILFSTGTFIDYGIAAASLNRKVRERLSGSPRKVGGASEPPFRKVVEWLHQRMAAAQNLPYEEGDVCLECADAVRDELQPLMEAALTLARGSKSEN